MTEYEFTPRQVTARRGAELNVRNEGELAHNLTVERGGERLTGTDTFLAGRSTTLKIDIPPGRYEIVCTVPDHARLGMAGSLRVR